MSDINLTGTAGTPGTNGGWLDHSPAIYCPI